MSLPTSQASSCLFQTRRIGSTQSWSFVFFIVILLTVVTACASSGKGKSHGVKEQKLQLTPAQLQVKVRALADPFSGIIEETVWELWQTDESSKWRQELLIWQINVVNAIQRATFQPKPLAALFDTWALVSQLRDYAENAVGDRHSEEQAHIVIAAADRMETSILKIAVEAGGEDGAANAKKLIREWVDKNPIDQFATRTSTDSELAQWTARGNMGTLATVKSLGASLDDVMARLDLYSEYIPKQASWHAQAVAYDWIAPEHTRGMIADLSKTANAFDRIAFSLEGIPQLVADERGIVLGTVQSEREHVIRELLTEVADMQLFVEAQRVDFMENQFRIEREAIFEAIALERATIIAEAKQERADAMTDFDEIAEGLIERSTVRIVDHFFVRALQLVALLLVGLGLIAVVVVLIWKRK